MPAILPDEFEEILGMRETAAEVAHKLEKLIDAWRESGQIQSGSAPHTELEGFLWESKVKILHILRAVGSIP